MRLELDAGAAVGLSFPDCVITEFAVSPSCLSFVSDGVFVSGRGLLIAPCRVRCSTAGIITLRRYSNSRWDAADLSDLRGLDEILEWVVEGCTLKIAGFERDLGLWIELVIPHFSLVAKIEVVDQEP